MRSELLSLLTKHYIDHKTIDGSSIAESLKGCYHDLWDLLPVGETMAILDPSDFKKSVSHGDLKDFIRYAFDLRKFNIPYGARVALMLPNGPHLAVALVALLSHWCCAPINANNTLQETISELKSTGAVAIIAFCDSSDNRVGQIAIEAADSLSIGVINLKHTPSGKLFELESCRQVLPRLVKSAGPTISTSVEGFVAYDHPETSLLLHTSGTSGDKKLVPYSLDMLVVGVACIILAWKLKESDVCLNMMPLFHIGGIVRNVLAPILSGGAVIACSGFDPVLFWDILESGRAIGSIIPSATWYYAAPTMHHAIILECEKRLKPLPVDRMRFIANAAGALLPALAEAVKRVFPGAVILTGYGMTECMPISSPPLTYKLDPPGTSGQKIGPDIAIADESTQAELPAGSIGNIFVRGVPCFGGYLNNQAANAASFISLRGVPGWFNTGDCGYLDENGFLFITGRSKEIINRGGETISPFEIEEVVVQHPLVKETLAFSTPHDQLQETVGVVIVPKHGVGRLDLLSLHSFLDNKLHRSKWPQLLVFMDALPKNSAGKLLRIKLASRLNLPEITDKTSQLDRLYEALCPAIGTPLGEAIVANKVNIFEETALQIARSYPFVREAILHRVDLPLHPQALVFFVGPRTPSSILDEMRRAFDSNVTINRYSLPMLILTVDVLPSTSAAADALASKGWEDIQASQMIAPRNPVEHAIARIWERELKLPKDSIGVTSNFFDIGGDSLKAGRVANDMRKALKIPLSVADLFAHPTVEKLAVKVETDTPSIQRRASRKASTDGSGNRSLLERAISLSRRLSRGWSSGGGGGLESNPKDGSSSRYSRLADFDGNSGRGGEDDAYSSTSLMCLSVQLIPIFFLYPFKHIAPWFMFLYFWIAFSQALGSISFGFILASFSNTIVCGFAWPLISISTKWMIAGQFRPGVYRLWSPEYLRWWIVNVTFKIFGIGFLSPNLFLTLMGARIGNNVKIGLSADFSVAADLLTIGDDVCIDSGVKVRTICFESRFIVMLPVTINRQCTLCTKSIVAAGSNIPHSTHLPPLSSSLTIGQANPKYRKYCRVNMKGPTSAHLWYIGYPILFFHWFVSHIPYFLGIVMMYLVATAEGFKPQVFTEYSDAVLYWADSRRLPLFFMVRIMRCLVTPWFALGSAVVLKRNVIGRFSPSPDSKTADEEADVEQVNGRGDGGGRASELHSMASTLPRTVKPRDDWYYLRYWLMANIMPGGSLCGLSKLIGTHYEGVSNIYRLLGARIGKRVYWPGSGIEIVEFDLLEVGDDVVFGSRSVVMTSSTERSAPVVIDSGCMVADRCVMLPNTHMKKFAVLGSGGLTAENSVLGPGSVWVGSSGGAAVNVVPAENESTGILVKDSTTPFGRAFYEGKASYPVFSQRTIFLYSMLMEAFGVCWRHASPLLSVFIVCRLFDHDENDDYAYADVPGLLLGLSGWSIASRRMPGNHTDFEYRPFESVFSYNASTVSVQHRHAHFVYTLLSLSFLVNTFLQPLMIFLGLCFVIGAKWFLMGRRTHGSFTWEESNYCQLWQVFLCCETIRRDVNDDHLELIMGSAYLVWYFRALGCSIGKDVCLYPCGGDPMMTEPDLVTIGDYASVDDASLVAHINTKGVFKLNPVHVGARCSLKANTRLLSGGTMESGSVLREHTLVMSGEIVDRDLVWQGWPCSSQMTLREYRYQVMEMVSKALKEDEERFDMQQDQDMLLALVKMAKGMMKRENRNSRRDSSTSTSLRDRIPSWLEVSRTLRGQRRWRRPGLYDDPLVDDDVGEDNDLSLPSKNKR